MVHDFGYNPQTGHFYQYSENQHLVRVGIQNHGTNQSGTATAVTVSAPSQTQVIQGVQFSFSSPATSNDITMAQNETMQ